MFQGNNSLTSSTTKMVITNAKEDADVCASKGFAALVVPTESSIEEKEQLKETLSAVQTIYLLINNADQASVKNLIAIGKTLALMGKAVFLTDIPRMDPTREIPLETYFAVHSASDFTNLLARSQSLLDVLIAGMPADFIRAEGVIKSSIAPLLVGMSKTSSLHYAVVMRKKLKTSLIVINGLIEEARKAHKKTIKI